MKRSLSMLVSLAIVLPPLVAGCGMRRPEVRDALGEPASSSRPTLDLHDHWDHELERMARAGAREADVVALLGATPEYCEESERADPTLGLVLGSERDGAAVVASVRPGGPAALAGLEPGMRIRRVGDEAVRTRREAVERIRSSVRVGEPVVLVTAGRTHEVVPVRRDELLGTRKCYWAPGHGRVGPSASPMDELAGVPESQTSGYRVACRFRDGVLTECASVHRDDAHHH